MYSANKPNKRAFASSHTICNISGYFSIPYFNSYNCISIKLMLFQVVSLYVQFMSSSLHFYISNSSIVSANRFKKTTKLTYDIFILLSRMIPMLLLSYVLRYAFNYFGIILSALIWYSI